MNRFHVVTKLKEINLDGTMLWSITMCQSNQLSICKYPVPPLVINLDKARHLIPHRTRLQIISNMRLVRFSRRHKKASMWAYNLYIHLIVVSRIIQEYFPHTTTANIMLLGN